MSETITWDESKLPLLNNFSISTIQRVGYLLERIDHQAQADNLYALIKQTGKTMRKTPLKLSSPFSGDMQMDRRWKIIENYKIEIDDI